MTSSKIVNYKRSRRANVGREWADAGVGGENDNAKQKLLRFDFSRKRIESTTSHQDIDLHFNQEKHSDMSQDIVQKFNAYVEMEVGIKINISITILLLN